MVHSYGASRVGGVLAEVGLNDLSRDAVSRTAGALGVFAAEGVLGKVVADHSVVRAAARCT